MATDPIADMLTRIRNAASAKLPVVDIPASNLKREIARVLQEKGFIIFYGFQPNVKPFIEKAHCVILPSWHEGMSNTLLEGASMGRPLITNNIHGCMEAVEDGKNGFLAKLKDKESLKSVHLLQHLHCPLLSHDQEDGRKRVTIC